MSQQQTENDLPVERRQSIFLALVEAQDGGLSVKDSLVDVAQKFSLTVDEIKNIEREGLANQWPPL